MAEHVCITIDEARQLKLDLTGKNSLPQQRQDAKTKIKDNSDCPECRKIIAGEIGCDSEKPMISFT